MGQKARPGTAHDLVPCLARHGTIQKRAVPCLVPSAPFDISNMNAFFGGFAAAIISYPLWVMNVVPAHKPTTLGVIYDRGLIGVYHDWCEPFSTYPRTYDLIHVADIDSLTKDPSSGKNRCNLVDLMVEMDRIPPRRHSSHPRFPRSDRKSRL